MPLTDADGAEFALDDQLEELAAGIIERIGLAPPALKAKLKPPQLRITKVPCGINSYCVPGRDGAKTIVVGADLYPFILQYTRAAAAFFLPNEPGGPRPSPFWPPACSSVATTLDWISSPAPNPLYPQFDLTPHQAHVARAFAAYAFRFALCHEMAHVALGHFDGGTSELRTVAREEIEVFRVSQLHELEADRLGLEFQFKSLPDDTQIVTGLASAVYFVHVIRLLDVRLMLLAHLVDHMSWKIEYSHPPYPHRLLNLEGTAERLYRGSGSGLNTVHDGLAGIESELFEVANKQQDAVAAAASSLVGVEVANHRKLPGERAPSGRRTRVLDVPYNPASEVIQALLRLFNDSPLGVLRALEPSLEASGALNVEEDQLKSLVVERVALVLPSEFQRFRLLTRAQRAKEVA